MTGAGPAVALSSVDGRGWDCVDFVSDLHLQEGEPGTWSAFAVYLSESPAQALFVLGDLFEAWVGDDVLSAPSGSFERRVVNALHEASERMAVFWMVGNRDFLTGPAFAGACGAQPLADPCRLQLAEEAVLLSHGDALCLDDRDYLAFRAKVRSAAWQKDFLAQPLHQRQAQARQMREQSQARQQSARSYADVDDEAARSWLREWQVSHLVHGHTHRPAEHDLGAGLRRSVLSDWCDSARPPRAQVLRWQHGWHRLSLAGSAQK
jgi:UDP-2,3-diacylglucosamine hydrolase